VPRWANTLERDRARAYFLAYAAAMAMEFVEHALERVYQGDVRTFTDFKVPDDAIGCGFHEAVRGVLSHHLVIRDRKIANYHPYPPTPWNASPRDSFGTPGPYEDGACLRVTRYISAASTRSRSAFRRKARRSGVTGRPS
jgi:hydrogenase large subunit